MHRFLLILAALLPLPAAAQMAQPTTWTFSYTGFLDSSTGIFNPAARLAGSFKGSDLNGNNVIELPELESFMVAGREFLMGYCNLDAYLRCNFRYFTYDNGTLNFDLSWWGNDEAISSWSGHVITGEKYSGDSSHGSESWSWTGLWTSKTTFNISPPPPAVPEPGMAAMLGAGLFGLAVWQRRRRR